VTDHAWMDEISPASESPFLFIAEGLFMYLPDFEVKRLLLELDRRFPGSQILADTISPLYSVLYAWHPTLRMFGIQFHSVSIGSQQQLDRWSSGVRFEREWSLLDYHFERWRWVAALRHVPWLRSCLKIVSLRLGALPRKD